MDAVRRFADLDAFPAKNKAERNETTYIPHFHMHNVTVPSTAVAVEHAIRVSTASAISDARCGNGCHVPPNLTAHIGVSAQCTETTETTIPVRQCSKSLGTCFLFAPLCQDLDDGSLFGWLAVYLDIPQLYPVVAVVDEVRHRSDSKRKRHHSEQHSPCTCADQFLALRDRHVAVEKHTCQEREGLC